MDPQSAIVGVAFFMMLLGAFVSLGPIGRALGDRLRGHPKGDTLDTGEVEALRDELAALRHQLAELAERQDFAERLLAQARERGSLQAPREG